MWGASKRKRETVVPRRATSSSGPGPQRGRRPLWWRLIKWSAILGIVGAALLAATVAIVFWTYGRDASLPDYKNLSDYRPKQVTTILDAKDQRIGELYGDGGEPERRTFVPYEQLPPILVDAFVAAEDNSFWEHAGVDYWGMFRAFLTNVRAGSTKQGASTITQQVVKTFLLTPERTFKRKIQEIILARRLESSLTKQEIMTLYVNQIFFGHGRYGVQEAARFYFGKDVSKLNVGEAALLGGLPQAPNNISPHVNPQRAKERQTYVLNQLVSIGKLTKEEAQKWIDAPIQVVKEPFPELDHAPEWRRLVRNELFDDKGIVRPGMIPGQDGATIDTLGATVRTTLDPKLQDTAQAALQNGLRALDKRRNTGRPIRTVKPDAIDGELTKLRKRLPKGGPHAKEVYDAVVTAVNDDKELLEVDLGGWAARLQLGGSDDARYNPRDDDGKVKRPSERFKRGDVIEVVRGAASSKASKDSANRPSVTFAPGPEGAVVIIDVKTRKVRALVGGYAPKVEGLNRAVQAHRQAGSSFKPFVYGAAIESGKYTAASTVNDAPEVFDLWRPKNYESGKFEGPVVLRRALARSINTVAIRVTHDIKPETVASFAQRMGVQSKLPNEMSLALGSGEVTPLEMTNSMATFAAGGIAAPPRFIDSIDGKAVPVQPGKQVLAPEVAYVVADMMRSVVTEGTGSRANALKIPIAGKTGTSNDAKDVWFIGLTPDYAIGVWLGYDEPRSMGKATGGGNAAPIFVEIAKAMALPAKQFVRPPKIVEVTIDKASGLLAPEGAPAETTRPEVFVEGTAPTEYATKPGDVTESNLVTGEYGD
ncbi:MAG: penicillin-binding protein 1A [Kofleriaceae bacterium]